MSGKKRSFIVVEAGANVGKKIVLKKKEYSIGTERKSTIRVGGAYVSPLHAILREREAGQWVILNRSPNQTLVNNQIIDSKPLLVGDTIQIGAENLFKFCTIEDPPVKTSSSGDKSRSLRHNAIVKLLNRPVVLTLLIVYLLLIGGVFYFLAGESRAHRNDAWSRASVDAMLESTKRYLLEEGNFTKGNFKKGNSPEYGITVKGAAAVEGYDRISMYHRSGISAENALLQHEVNKLLENMRERLDAIWQLEQQQRFAVAVNEYRALSETLPSLDIPIVQTITARIQWIESNKDSGK